MADLHGVSQLDWPVCVFRAERIGILIDQSYELGHD